ncbi:MAG: DNA-binding protein [Chthoniobacteraceae bacterium]
MIRAREAKVLFKAREYSGAYYLCGYAVECALKARIAKTVQRYDFPNKDFATKVFVHDLGALLNHAQLTKEFQADSKISPQLEIDWAFVKDWSEKKRYEIIREQDAKDLLEAVTQPRTGVLQWLKKYW